MVIITFPLCDHPEMRAERFHRGPINLVGYKDIITECLRDQLLERLNYQVVNGMR